MVITVHGGHNANVPGASSLLDEVKEDRIITALVIQKLRVLGFTVYDTTDDMGMTPNAVLRNVVSNSNSYNADLNVAIHFNAGAYDLAGDGRTTGTEVLVYSRESPAYLYAEAISTAISNLGFQNRGVQVRPNLYVLKYTRAPTVLVECCFVDDADDAALYDADAMATAIVRGITGLALDPALTRRYTAQFQQWLNAYFGTGISADGLWGPRTRQAAIRALQMELNHADGAGLTPDGLWGPKTQAALVSVGSGDKGYLVRIIQGVLYARGYDPNGFDGVYSSGTRTAVWFFQRDKNLEATGIVDPKTWAALLA